MKKLFSIKAFIFATLIHFVMTWSLIQASENAYFDWRRAGGDFDSLWINSVWLKVTFWILQPVALGVQNYLRHHPGDIFNRPNPLNYVLPWTLFVGVCFGFLMPCISQRRVGPGKD
jgi:hypothetical protein